MKETQSIKISLSTFLLVIAIIGLVIMGYFMYDLHDEKVNIEEKNIQLNEQILNLQNSLNKLQERINSVTDNKNTNKTENKEEISKEEFTIEQVKESIQKYLTIEGSGSVEEILVNSGIATYGKYTEVVDENLKKTDIKYEEFKNNMLKYMSETMFYQKMTESNWKQFFKDIDGILYFFDGGWSGIGYDVKEVSKNSDLYVAEGQYRNGEYKFKVEFTIENYNGNCVISSLSWISK